MNTEFIPTIEQWKELQRRIRERTGTNGIVIGHPAVTNWCIAAVEEWHKMAAELGCTVTGGDE